MPVVHRGRFNMLSPAVASPVRAPRTLRRWATVGRSSPSFCVKVAVLSGPLVAACVSPLDSPDSTNEKIRWW